MDKVNKTTGQDIGYAVLKAAAGSLPILGAAAGELLGLLVTPPLERRREQWMTDVGERLDVLAKASKIDYQKLMHNDQFVDTVLQATTYALKTSMEEKRQALKNVILNTALGNAPESTKSHMFLSSLDTFTELHIRILAFVDNPDEWFTKNPVAKFEGYAIGENIRSLIMRAFPELTQHDDLLNRIILDLQQTGYKSAVVKSNPYIRTSYITPLGKEFLEFISKND